jgi:hypothetical protein
MHVQYNEKGRRLLLASQKNGHQQSTVADAILPECTGSIKLAVAL